MKKAWKEAPWYVKLIIIALALVILFFLFRWLRVQFKKYSAEKKLAEASSNYTAGGSVITVNFGSVAQTVYDSFYNNDWFGWTEDEETAIVAINNVPKPLIPQLKQTYFDLYGKNLNEDCIKYLKDEYPRVQNILA